MVVVCPLNLKFSLKVIRYLFLAINLTECCCVVFRIRFSTWRKLTSLRGGILSAVLSEILLSDPISPVLSQPHHHALNRRLATILVVIEKCIDDNGVDPVFVHSDDGEHR